MHPCGLLCGHHDLRSATIADKATFTEPHQYPVGIDWVIVNGTPVVSEGKLTDATPGRVLKHVPSRN